MQTNIGAAVAVSVALAAAACSGEGPRKQNSADTPRRVTVVGCLERGEKADEFLVAGRAVNRVIEPPTGKETGGLVVTETGPGGDPYRVARPGVLHDMSAPITPRLVAAGSNLGSQVGHRIVATGEFEPATADAKTGLLKAETVDEVAPNCLEQ